MTTKKTGLKKWSEHELQLAFAKADAQIASLQHELRETIAWKKAAQDALAAQKP